MKTNANVHLYKMIFAILFFVFFLFCANTIYNQTIDAIKHVDGATYVTSKVNEEKLSDNMSLVPYIAGETTTMYVLINFISYKNDNLNKFSSSQIEDVKLYFNDNVSDNNIFSVHEYFYQQSQGKLNVWAIFMEGETEHSKSYFEDSVGASEAFARECAVFTEILGKHKEPFVSPVDNVTIVDKIYCRINYFAGNATSQSSNFWPKNWSSTSEGGMFTAKGLIMFVQYLNLSLSTKDVGVMCHELTHMMGIADYYTQKTTFAPVGKWDLMGATNYKNPQTLSPYFRQKMGFFDESDYYDNIYSQIENITSSGRYTIKDSSYFVEGETGALALKFGIRNGHTNEFFMIEFKYKNYSGDNAFDYYTIDTGLIVYRINEYYNATGNYNATSQTNCGMYIFRDNNDEASFQKALIVSSAWTKKYLQSYGSINDSDTNLIRYSNGDNSKIVIKNLEFNSLTKEMSFDVEFVNNLYSVAGTITKDGTTGISGVSVLVNGVDSKIKTDENGYYFVKNLKFNDIISFNKSDVAIEQEFIVKGNCTTANVNVISKMDLTFNIKYDGVGLNDVCVYVNSNFVGKTNALGLLEVKDVELLSIITFERKNYDFIEQNMIFSDIKKSTYEINSCKAVRNLQFNVYINAILLPSVDFYVNNKLYSNLRKQEDCYLLYDITIGDIISIKKNNYTFSQSTFTFNDDEHLKYDVVASKIFDDKDLSELKFVIKDFDTKVNISEKINFYCDEIEVPFEYNLEDGSWRGKCITEKSLIISKSSYRNVEYQVNVYSFEDYIEIDLKHQFNCQIVVVDNFDSKICNVEVFLNNVFVGKTDSNGLILLYDIASEDVIMFCGMYCEEKNIMVSAKSLPAVVILTYKLVDVQLKVSLYSGEAKLIDGIVVKINNKVEDYVSNENIIFLEARYYDRITFEQGVLRFTKLIVTPENTQNVYNVISYNPISVIGNVQFERNDKLFLIYSIYANNIKVGQTDSLGNYALTNCEVYEGDKISFKALNFHVEDFVVEQNETNLKVYSKLDSKSCIIIQIIFIVIGVIMLSMIVISYIISCKYKRTIKALNKVASENHNRINIQQYKLNNKIAQTKYPSLPSDIKRHKDKK